MTEITTGPVTDEFAEAAANQRSVFKAIAYMAGRGKLGTLAKELTELADNVAKNGYVPPKDRKELDRLENLAKSVQDKELAAYYRAKAKRIREQLGESRTAA